MDGKINKKTIAIIAVIAILLVAAISLTAVFLNDQGETEATVGDTSASNGSEEQNAQEQSSSEENNNVEEQQPAEESEQATDDNEEETEVARTDNNADVDVDNDNNDNDANTTTATDDSQTVLVDEEVQTATELVNAGWNNTEIGISQLSDVEALNPELTSKLEVSTEKIENQNVEVEYKITISNSSDIDAKQIMVSMDIPEGVEFVSAENANYHEELGKVIWVVDVNANNSTELTLKVRNDIYRGEFTAIAVVDGTETNEVTTIVDDTKAPKITIKPSTNPEGQRTIGKDGEYSEISFALEDNWMLKEFEINDTLFILTQDKWSDANYDAIKPYLVQGKNTIIVRDMAGNETEFTFIYDSIAPKYKYLGIARNKSKEDTRSQQYAKVGDSVRVLVAFSEKLDVIPTVKMFGKEYEATYRPDSSIPSANTYYYMADIKMTKDMPEGEIPFEIYGYADKAGNVGLDLANDDINLKTFPKVILDKTDPELIIKGSEGEEGTITVGKDGEYSQISFKLFDNIALDKIEINGHLIDKPAVQWNDANYMNIKQYLKEGENIVVLTDMAGNETELKFIYDITAPKHVKVQLWDKENRETETIRNGQTVRVDAVFSEKLETLPTLKIGNQTVTMQETTDGKSGIIYQADITIAEDESEIPEGRLPFVISGYADKAGNVGEDITEKSENVTGIMYDRTNPGLRSMGIFNWSNNNKGNGLTPEYARTGDHIRLFVTFTEDLGTLPKVDIYGENNKVTTLDLKWSTAAKFYFVEFDISEKMNLPQGKIQYKIYGYTDKAGNAGKTITQDETTDKRYLQVIYDSIKPVVELDGEGRNNYFKSEVVVNIKDENPGTVHLHKKDANGKYVPVDNYKAGQKITAEGEYRVYVADKAGNKSTTVEFVIDKTDPEVELEGKGKDNYYRTDVIVNIKDENPNTVHLKRQDENGEYKLVDNYKVGQKITEEGNYSVYVSDLAGNKSKTIYFVIDKTDPEIELSSKSGNNNYFKSDVVVNIKDENPGTVHLHKKDENGEYKLVDNYKAGQKITDEGDYRVYASDKAGNKSKTIYFVIDTTLPVIKGVENNGYYKNPVTVEIIEKNIQNAKVLFEGDWTEIDLDEENKATFTKEGTYFIRVTDKAYNTKAEVTFTIDVTNPKITPTKDSVGNDPYYSKVGFTVTDNYGVASYDLNGHTEIITDNVNLSYDTIDEFLNIGKNVITVTDKAGNTGEYVFYYKTTPATRLATNILENGKSNDGEFKKDGIYYVKPGDEIYMYISFNEKLAHNPTFTLINNGKRYKMEDELVKVSGPKGDNNRYDYSVIYEIPKDTDFVDGEIEFEVSNLEDIYGYKIADENGPTNEHKVYFDVTRPTVTLKGDQKIVLEAGIDKYKEEYATVEDNIDGFISDKYEPTVINYYSDPDSNKVTESNLKEVNTKRTGLYKIGYVYIDRAGNKKQATRFVYVEDTTLPKITLKGEKEITIEAGSTYVDEGAIVTDNVDETKEIKYSNINYYVDGKLVASHLSEVNTKKIGTYLIGFEYTDKAGNKKVEVRTVIVKDTKKPVVEVNGDSTITLNKGDYYDEKELGATVTDNAEVDYSRLTVVINYYADPDSNKVTESRLDKVDTSRTGKYKISYKYVDEAGNESNTDTRTVFVK